MDPSSNNRRWWLLAPVAASIAAATVWLAPGDDPPRATLEPEGARRVAVVRAEPEPPAPMLERAPVADAGAADAGTAAEAVDAGTDAGITLDAGTDAGTAQDAGSEPVTALALAELDAGAPSPERAEPAPGSDPRFGLRWSLPGHCGPGHESLNGQRIQLLATFAVTTLGGARFFHDPDIDPMRVLAAGDALVKGRSIAKGLIGPDAAAVAPPDIYLYAEAAEMRRLSCINEATAGYYDGAIHVAADDFDLEKTLIHETVHHVLNGLGVTKPMWLHEGLAMFAAQEKWWQDERLGLTKWLRRQHLPFESLALAFPHSSDELFAAAVYFQSLRMVEFVFFQSPDRGGVYRLIAGLRQGTIRPATAFGQSTGLSGAELEAAWARFVENR